MKIAIFTDIYTPSSTGGIVSSIKAQKSALEALGHDITIFCPGHSTSESNVVLVPSHPLVTVNGAVLADRLPIIERYVLEHYPNFSDFDLVHVHHELCCSVAGIRLAQRFHVPLVQTMHGREDMAIAHNVPHPLRFLSANGLNLLHGHYLPHSSKVKRDRREAPTLDRARMWELMVNHANSADVVLTPAEHFSNKLVHYGVTRPVRTVPNGITPDLIPASATPRALAPDEPLKMVWNSRVSHEKRILPFLAALTEVTRPFTLSVYGDGNALAPAKLYATRHHLPVKFLGTRSRSEIVDRMLASHLGILASYNFDTQGMVLIEAEATGLPVFFCDPTLTEVVPPHSFVLSASPDPSAMAAALNSITPAQISSMSEIMLKHRSQILQSAQIPKLLSAYDLALELHHSPSPTS